MLDALADRQPLKEPAGHLRGYVGLWLLLSALGRPPPLSQARHEVQAVVEAHPSDRHQNEHNIDSADQGHPWMLAHSPGATWILALANWTPAPGWH